MKEAGCSGGRTLLGEEVEKGECRLSSRSASETRTGSGVGTGLIGGGGIAVESKGWNDPGEGNAGDGSNLMVGLASTDGSGDCLVFGGTGFGCSNLVSRALFSDVYMTATLVEGEFMVPVSDHPIAALL